MPYTPSQSRAINDFKSVTGSDSKTAAKWLKGSDWNSTAAVNNYYNQNASAQAPSASTRNALTKLYEKYAGKDDSMDIEQLMPYFAAIGADPSNVSSLVVHEIMQCPEIGTINREGFVDGWSSLNLDTIDKQKKFLDSRTKTLGQPGNREVFRAVYKYAFELCITQQGQRLVEKDNLIELWRLLFTTPGMDWRTRNTNWIELWLEFVQGNSAKAFNRDVWSQTFRFAEESLKDESLGWWSEEASWPAVIDEFVEWMREKRGITKGNGDEDEDMEY